MENVLEVIQAAGWETSHWRVTLSGKDGSPGKSPRDSQVELVGWAAWTDRLTEVTVRCLSCEGLEGRLRGGMAGPWQGIGSD